MAHSTSNTQPAATYFEDESTQFIFVALLLLGIAFVQSSVFPTAVGYAVTLGGYSIIAYRLLRDGVLPLSYSRHVIVPVVGIWTIFTLHFVSHPSLGMLRRYPVYILIPAVNVFVLPQLIDVRVFLTTASRITAGLVFLGLPTVVGFDIGPVTAWHTQHSILQTPVLRSVFANPNTLGVLCLAGTIASFWELRQTKSRLAGGLLSLCLLGIFLSDSQAAWVALIVAFALLLFYRFRSHVSYTAVIFAGGSVGMWFLTATVGLLPTPPVLSSATFSGRTTLWRAAWEASSGHRLLGFGPVSTGPLIQNVLGTAGRSSYAPHSFFFQMLLMSGVIGLGFYLYLWIRTVLGSVRRVGRPQEFAVFGIMIAVLVTDVFTGATIFGLSTTATLLSITLGYVQS